jgi:glycosyltransferase involved in cell wall biosynthesis
MKILQVCQPTDGGVAQQVEILSKELIDRSVLVEVACAPGPLADKLRHAGIKVFTLPLVRSVSPRNDLYAAYALWRIICKGGYSLVHTHSAKAGAVGRLAARLAGVPAIYTPHAWSFLAAESRLERHVYIAIERVLASFTRRIVCVSAGEMELGRWVVRVGFDKLRLVPNGVVAPAPVQSRDGGEVVIGSVCRLTRQKGVTCLIRAAEAVRRERGGSVRFSVSGDGPDLGLLKAEINRLGLGEGFELVGAVGRSWDHLSSHDVFVLPSLWEGMPFILLEAMGAGLPVVATDVGGVRDVITDDAFGFVVPPADADALKVAILRYVDRSELRRSVGVAARERILHEFGQERMVEGNLSVYVEALGGCWRG